MIRGKKIITTQPAEGKNELIEILRSKGADVYHMPTIEIHTIFHDKSTIRQTLKQKPFTWVVFTSRNGVDGFFSNLQCFYPKFFEYQNCKIAVVGESTARELENHGLKPDIINPGNTGKDLSEYLIQDILHADDSVLFPAGNLAPDTMEETISKVCDFTRFNVYETRYPLHIDERMRQIIENDESDMVVFTSPSGFLGYLHFFGKGKKLNFAAIGSKTAQEIKQNGFDVCCIASKPGMKELSNAISEFFGKQAS